MTKKVLVADDNRDAADSLVVLLDWLGYEAIACYDGAQAVQLARTYKPDGQDDPAHRGRPGAAGGDHRRAGLGDARESRRGRL